MQITLALNQSHIPSDCRATHVLSKYVWLISFKALYCCVIDQRKEAFTGAIIALAIFAQNQKKWFENAYKLDDWFRLCTESR